MKRPYSQNLAEIRKKPRLEPLCLRSSVRANIIHCLCLIKLHRKRQGKSIPTRAWSLIRSFLLTKDTPVSTMYDLVHQDAIRLCNRTCVLWPAPPPIVCRTHFRAGGLTRQRTETEMSRYKRFYNNDLLPSLMRWYRGNEANFRLQLAAGKLDFLCDHMGNERWYWIHGRVVSCILESRPYQPPSPIEYLSKFREFMIALVSEVIRSSDTESDEEEEERKDTGEEEEERKDTGEEEEERKDTGEEEEERKDTGEKKNSKLMR